MGRMLGAFDDADSVDRPDLNKCPDCSCFFAQEECPICGKVCPEEMRAGVRKPEKKKKQQGYYSGRVTFVEWYHSWWFFLITLLFMPFVSIILASTSPYRKKMKTVLIVVAVVVTLVSYTGIGNLVYYSITEWSEKPPVNTELSREAYVAECQAVDGEALYRNADSYRGEYLKVTLRVKKVLTGYPYTESADFDFSTVYLCEKPEDPSFTVLVQACFVGSQPKLVAGDMVTFYGQGAGELSLCDESDPAYPTYTMAALFGAYLELCEA